MKRKNLLLLLLLFTAPTSWSEIIGLSCEAIAFQTFGPLDHLGDPMSLKEENLNYKETFLINTEEKTVEFEGASEGKKKSLIRPYVKDGTKIEFNYMNGPWAHLINLDLVSRDMYDNMYLLRTEERHTSTALKCKEMKPLF